MYNILSMDNSDINDLLNNISMIISQLQSDYPSYAAMDISNDDNPIGLYYSQPSYSLFSENKNNGQINNQNNFHEESKKIYTKHRLNEVNEILKDIMIKKSQITQSTIFNNQNLNQKFDHNYYGHF